MSEIECHNNKPTNDTLMESHRRQTAIRQQEHIKVKLYTSSMIKKLCVTKPGPKTLTRPIRPRGYKTFFHAKLN